MGERHHGRHGAFEPVYGTGCGQLIDFGRVAARIDRATHENERRGFQIIIALGHQCRCDQAWNGRLADAHHVSICADEVRKFDQVVDEIIKIEASHCEWNFARVHPIGDVDIVLGQHGLDGAAQQRCIMPRHRGDDQHLGIVAAA